MIHKMIPGYSTAQNLASAGGGAIIGGGIVAIMSHLDSTKKKKEITSLKEEVKNLNKRIGVVDIEEQKKAILKVGILKQLAWKDSKLHEKEFKFIVEYIVQCKKLELDIKLMLIDNLAVKPPLFSQIFEPINKFFSGTKCFFDNDEEKHGFINILESLINADGEVHKSEKEFIEELKKI